ncbi:MAG: ABC transporter ATP-binding protein/permease [Actinomycetota bacterium]|nr:ABC transporter ATP-binding protein/permease [Actinomycetota bacterium]
MRAAVRRMRRVYGVILRLAWAEARDRAVALLVVAVVWGVLTTVTALTLKLVVDAVADGAATRAWVTGLIGLAVVVASRIINDLSGGLWQTELGERVSQAVEQRLMAVAGTAPGLEHLERAEFADKVKLVRDRAWLPYFAFTNLNTVSGTLCGLLGAIVLLATVHPALMLMPVVALPGVVLQFRAYRSHFARYDHTAPEERLAQHYLELATEPPAAKEVRLFGLGPELLERQRRVTDRYIRLQFRDQLRRSTLSVASGALYGAAMAGAIAFVGWLAMRGRATLGDVALTVQVARMAIGDVQSATRQTAWLAELSFAGERYLWLLDYRPAVVGKPTDEAAPAPTAITDGITLDRVSFAYPGTAPTFGHAAGPEPVLSDVSLHLPAGATVALVGENGAGKTSLVKLLCRFYDPTEGRILVDGIDLRDIDLDGWRAATSVAFQDFVRFHLVAREAVGVGDLPAADDRERVAVSAARAGADRVIARLPSGFDTQLGRSFEDGVDLSEGEWQRVALARGLMRTSPVLLVLDEPTASLDPRAEHKVFERFSQMAAGTVNGHRPITLLVSHRFSTVRMADLIVVLHQGRIEEVGSHDDLVATGGRYAELFRLQASRYSQNW